MKRASVFIYYRVRPECTERVGAVLTDVVAFVARRCGVDGRWMRRRDDAAMFMEFYDAVDDTDRLQSAAADAFSRLGGNECLVEEGHRHIEIFIAPD